MSVSNEREKEGSVTVDGEQGVGKEKLFDRVFIPLLTSRGAVQ
jgi:hypothetical protein